MSETRPSATVAMSADELGSYQSLNTLAVISFLLGLLSVLSFAPFHLFLWALPPMAVLTGFLALRRIAEAPEVWTGKKLAQAGIAIAIACALCAILINFYTNVQIEKHGKALAERFVEKIRQGDIESAYWLTIPRENRQEFFKRKLEDVPEPMVETYVSFRSEWAELAKSLALGEASVEFEDLEATNTERGLENALVVYKFHAPTGDSHGLFVVSGGRSQDTGEMNWFLREYKLDYSPHSYVGHQPTGHSHSH